MSVSTPTKTFFFSTGFDSAYGHGALYNSTGSRIEMKDRGPFPDYTRAEDAPEVEFSEIEIGRSYWECASLPAGHYWHVNQDVIDETLRVIEVSPSGWGDVRRIVTRDGYTHPRDVLRKLRDNAVPRWVQDIFLDSLPYYEFAKLVQHSGRKPLQRLHASCFTRMSQDGVWLYQGDGRMLVADLIEGRVIDVAALPRRTKKAFATPAPRRTLQQRRLISHIENSSMGRWSGGFQVDDALDSVEFDGDLQKTFDTMSALMDGERLIDPRSLFGGIKYTVLEYLTTLGHLTYKDAYKYAAERFGSDDRLDMPVGTYDYDLLFHWAWKDIASKVRRAAKSVS